MAVCLSDSAGEVMRRLPPGPLPAGWWWLDEPNGPDAELIIPTRRDFEAARLAPPALNFDQYMSKRIVLGFMEAARVARARARGDVEPIRLRVPELTVWAFRLMAEWAADADDTRRVHLTKARQPLALGLNRKPSLDQQRKPSPDALLLSPPEAADRLGVTVEQLTGFVSDGDLPYVNVGRGKKRPRYKFKPSDIDALIEARQTREVPCPSTNPKNRPRTSGTTSKSVVVGFTALRAAQLAARRKK
jgi:hypothetical protein